MVTSRNHLETKGMCWAPKTWNIDSRCWLTVTHTHTQLGIWVSIKHGISPLKLRRSGKMTQPEGEFSPILMKVHQFPLSCWLDWLDSPLIHATRTTGYLDRASGFHSRWGTNWMIRRGHLCWETSKASTKPGGDWGELCSSVGKMWVWINTYENTILSGMNIHKSQLFWGELQGYYWFWHTAMWKLIFLDAPL